MKGYNLFLFAWTIPLFFSACATMPRESITQSPAVSSSVQQPESAAESSSLQGRENNRVTQPVSPRQVASIRVVELGKKNIETGHYDRGITILEQAITLNGYNAMAYYYLALAWLKKGDAERALTFSRKAELFSQDDRGTLRGVYLLEGEIFQKLGNVEKSRWYREKAARLR